MHFWGMHLFWWLFWMIILITFFTTIDPIPRSKARLLRAQRETPLETLQRRYAAGDLSSQDYEERKSALERDASVTVK